MNSLFFQNWESLVRTAVITVLAYVAMVTILRVSGKRTLSKMNAFDFIVTIALGSTLATVALSKTVPLIDGVVAFALLVFLQFLITWLSVRVNFFKELVTSKPIMLLYKGEILEDVLKKERISIEEINKAARQKGIADLNEVDIVVLETTGDFTIVPKIGDATFETMKDVVNYRAGASDWSGFPEQKNQPS